MEFIEGDEDTQYERHTLPFSPEDTPPAIPPPPWLERFFGLWAEDIHRTLAEDWSVIRSPSLANFRDAVLRYRPFSMVHDYQRWRLEMRREAIRDGDSLYPEHTIYIETALDPAALEMTISSMGFADHDVIEEFYRYFYGLADAPVDDYAAGFVRPEKWERFESYGWDEEIERFDPSRKWARSVVIYQVGDGDMILLDPISGETAWVLLAVKPATGPFVAIAPSFAELLDVFARSPARRHLWLDYYRWLEMQNE